MFINTEALSEWLSDPSITVLFYFVVSNWIQRLILHIHFQIVLKWLMASAGRSFSTAVTEQLQLLPLFFKVRLWLKLRMQKKLIMHFLLTFKRDLFIPIIWGLIGFQTVLYNLVVSQRNRIAIGKSLGDSSSIFVEVIFIVLGKSRILIRWRVYRQNIVSLIGNFQVIVRKILIAKKKSHNEILEYSYFWLFF